MQEYRVLLIWRHMKRCLILEGPSQDLVVLCLRTTFPHCRIISVTPIEVPVQ